MLKHKTWHDNRSKDTWSMFKMMAEFVNGYQHFDKLGPCVTILGSRSTPAKDPFYQLAEATAQRLVKKGYGVITGGGNGIMAAANKGAQAAKGTSIGVGIRLPNPEPKNEYIDTHQYICFDDFFIRKIMFLKYAQAFIFFPGGFGTLDELFEILMLLQTQKIKPLPLVLMGTAYWQGLKDWLQHVVHDQSKHLSAQDLALLPIVDTAEAAVQFIETFYKKSVSSPNF